MKAIHNAAMAVFCFVLIAAIDAILDVNDYPQG
jgi:hypothetical protein